MRTAGSLPFVHLSYFVLSHICGAPHRSTLTSKHSHTHTHTHTHTHARTHTNAHVCIICKRASPLQRLQSVHKANGRRRKIRRRAGCFFRGRGSTSEGPLISHNLAKLNTRKKWRHMACWGRITSQNSKFIAVPHSAVPSMMEVMFLISLSLCSFLVVSCC